MKESSYIYALVEPQTNEVFYVGVTQRPLFRLATHVRHTSNKRLALRFANIFQQNLRPKMRILETVTEEERSERERYWIVYHLRQGADLCNIGRVYHINGRRLSLDEIENRGKWKIFKAAIRPDQDERIEKLAKEWDIDRSDVVRKLLDIALKTEHQ